MRECKNCIYSRGGGSDVWCTHEPKGKESYMCDTDCPYWTPYVYIDTTQKVTLKDIAGIVKTEDIKGRFQEILSLKKIKDTKTNIEYDGLVDTEFLKLINEIDEENHSLKIQRQKQNNEQRIMNTKHIYRVFDKETNHTLAWFTDSEDLFYMTEWYSDEIEYCVEEYKLIDSW